MSTRRDRPVIEPIAYSTSEMGKLLGLSVSGARRLILDGEVPAFRIGKRILVMRSDFEAFVARQRAKGLGGPDEPA